TPDGRSLLTSGEDTTARLRCWDVATGRLAWESPQPTRSLTRVSFRPDGKAVAGEVAGRVVTWDLATGRELTPDAGHAAGLLRVGFSPDGRRVVTDGRDGTRREWDAATGRPLATQPLFSPDASYAVATPDGRQVVTMQLPEAGGWVIRLRDVA